MTAVIKTEEREQDLKEAIMDLNVDLGVRPIKVNLIRRPGKNQSPKEELVIKIYPDSKTTIDIGTMKEAVERTESISDKFMIPARVENGG